MNRRMAMPLCVTVGLASILLCGCASTHQTVPIATGPIAVGNARIEVLRPKQFYGTAAPIEIADSGTPIGTIGSGGQLLWDRPAGSMVLTASNTLEPSRARQGEPLRVGVGGGSTYQFSVVFPFSGHSPILELMSGTPVAFDESETNASAANVASVQQPSSDGETKTLRGTLKAFPRGPGQFKSGPPLWPVGMIVVVDDNGVNNNFLVVESGKYATTFYDTAGKVLSFAQAKKVDKKLEVKYVVTTLPYANKAIAISVRYFD